MRDLEVDDLLVEGTCAILKNDQDGEAAGTAWLFSHHGHLLTAGHVLGKDNALWEVKVKFVDDIPRTAYRRYHGYSKKMAIDFAILQLERPPRNRRPLKISLARSVRGAFSLRGYGITLEYQTGGMGEFLGSAVKNSTSDKLFSLRSQDIAEEGYSGGAVFSHELQAVVAIQTETTIAETGARRDTVLAMPLYRIAKYWDELENLADLVPSSPPPPSAKPPTTSLSSQAQTALNKCFTRSEQIIEALPADEHDSAKQHLRDLNDSFLNPPPSLNTIRSTLAFFNPYSSALRQLKILLQQPALQRLVRRGGEQITKDYEQLVFSGD